MNLAKNFAIPAAIATSLSFAPANDADAALITGNYTGSVTNVAGTPSSFYSVGDEFEVDFTFDDVILNDRNVSNTTIGAYHFDDFSANPANEFVVSVNGETFDGVDFWSSVFDNLLGSFSQTSNQIAFDVPVAGLDVKQLFLSGSNPADDSLLAGFNDVSSFRFAFDEGGHDISGTIDTFEYDVIDTTPTPVPAPGTLVLLTAGLAGIGARKFLSNKGPQPA